MTETLQLKINKIYQNDALIEKCSIHLTINGQIHRLKVPSQSPISINITQLSDDTICTALIQKGIRFLARSEFKLAEFRTQEDIKISFIALEEQRGQTEVTSSENPTFDVELESKVNKSNSSSVKASHQGQSLKNPFLEGPLENTPEVDSQELKEEQIMDNFSKESFGMQEYDPSKYLGPLDQPNRKAEFYISRIENKLTLESQTLDSTQKNEFQQLLSSLKSSIKEFEVKKPTFEIDTNFAERQMQNITSPNFGSSPDKNVLNSGRSQNLEEIIHMNDVAIESKVSLSQPRNLEDLSRNYGQSGVLNQSVRSVLEEGPITKNEDYLLTFSKEMSAKTVGFIEDDFTRDIIIQMSRGKQKVAPFYILKSIQITEKEEIEINQAGYFRQDAQKQYLHFFKPNTRLLYLFSTLKPVEENYSEKSFKKDVDIDYKISPHHKSLIAPTGMIFIIGAKPIKHGEASEAKMHVFAYGTGQLHEKTPLPKMKSIKDFAICYLNKNIFLAGGVIDDHISNRFLRYDLRTNKWVELYGMPKKIRNASICGFGTKTVYRFFGIDTGDNIDRRVFEKIDRMKYYEFIWDGFIEDVKIYWKIRIEKIYYKLNNFTITNQSLFHTKLFLYIMEQSASSNQVQFFQRNQHFLIVSTIERYDASRNRWFKIDVNIDDHLRGIYLPMCIQIQSDAILVFGGQTIHSYPPKSCKAYVFRTDEKKQPDEAYFYETKNFIPGLAGNYSSSSLMCNLGEVSFLRESKKNIQRGQNFGKGQTSENKVVYNKNFIYLSN